MIQVTHDPAKHIIYFTGLDEKVLATIELVEYYNDGNYPGYKLNWLNTSRFFQLKPQIYYITDIAMPCFVSIVYHQLFRDFSPEDNVIEFYFSSGESCENSFLPYISSFTPQDQVPHLFRIQARLFELWKIFVAGKYHMCVDIFDLVMQSNLVEDWFCLLDVLLSVVEVN